jgi:beta-barrel assembly-enhancing protease
MTAMTPFMIRAVLFLALLGALPVRAQPSTNPPKGLFNALLETAAQAAGQIDRIGLEITRLSDAEESALGAEIDKAILRHTPAITNKVMQQRIERIAAPIIQHRQRPAIHYTVRILDSDEVNAYSAAGGFLYFTRAFLREFPSDAALAMTLGHEIGHVDLRHCVEKVQYLAVGREVAGDWAAMAQIAYGALRSAYTKEQEFEADKYGFDAARQAGWKAGELLNFVRGLAAYQQRQNAKSTEPQSSAKPSGLSQTISDYLATHPPSSERVKHLELLAKTAPAKSSGK